MSSKEIIAKMVGLYDQIGVLTEGLKELKDRAKTEGHDPAILSAVASAQSTGKSGKFRLKIENTLDLLDSLSD